MGVVRRFRSWWLMTLAAAMLALSWISTALAQQAGGDGDGPDNDELSVLAVVVGVAGVAAIGWLASRRRSSRPH